MKNVFLAVVVAITLAAWTVPAYAKPQSGSHARLVRVRKHHHQKHAKHHHRHHHAA